MEAVQAAVAALVKRRGYDTPAVAPPQDLVGTTLRPYQLHGVAWLAANDAAVRQQRPQQRAPRPRP
jgi:SNF2 family DNA or RNA helicase